MKNAIEKTAISGCDVPSLVAGLKKAVAGAKEPTIVISADAKTTHQSVVNVMEAAREAGYTHITFATQNGA